jgi:hypothetical protein
VRQRLGDISSVIVPEDLEPIALHFRVSPLVIQHQVENQLADDVVA